MVSPPYGIMSGFPQFHCTDMSFRSQIKMISGRRGRGDAGVHEKYIEEPMTKPTKIAL